MKQISAAVRRKAKKIRLLLLDVDGVLTDGRIVIDERGVESKNFHVRDGQGIALLVRAGIEVGFISARSSRAVSRRAKELGVRLVHQGVKDKLQTYDSIKQLHGIVDEQVAYVGDEIIDRAILRRDGLAVSVADGSKELVSAVDFITRSAGGKGAVREVAELLLKAQGTWPTLTN